MPKNLQTLPFWSSRIWRSVLQPAPRPRSWPLWVDVTGLIIYFSVALKGTLL